MEVEDEIEEGMVVDDAPTAPDLKVEKKCPYEMLRESKTSIEDLVAKMLSIRKESKSKSELRELLTQMFLNFVTLRQANRSILLEEDRVKAETEQAKAPVDFTTLQLHNLMYEKSHYLKAIKACKDFRSKYPDIELVPEEEFFQDAPEIIKEKVISDDSPHNLMLKRLNYELFQRKELCKLHEKLEQQKKCLLEIIANRKKFLSSLPSHLKSLKKASLPVQQQLGILHTKKLKQHQLAELLPPPLYVIYLQFLAQKEAFGEHIDLEIVGSLKDAQAFARQQANKDLGASTNVETPLLEDDAQDEEDEGQRRRKRPKKVSVKESQDPKGMYQVHSLKIILHVYDDDTLGFGPTKLITLKFDYLLKLNVVCVGIEGSNDAPDHDILCNLFPDDTGRDLPHQSAKLLTSGGFAFDERRMSRPYKWAQHLAGTDFLPEVSPMLAVSEAPSSESSKSSSVVSGLSLYRQQNRIGTVLRRIRSRKKAQLALAAQLDLLMKLKWPDLNCETVPWASYSPLCSLHGWSSTCPSRGSGVLPIDKGQAQEPIDDGKPGISKEEAESTREDGELPSLISGSSTINEGKPTAPKRAARHNSRQLTLISKSKISLIGKAKSPSLTRLDEDPDLTLETDSDMDEPIQMEEHEKETPTGIKHGEMADDSWVDYGAREFCIVLSRKMDAFDGCIKLEAKINVGVEYPLRPPLFSLTLSASFPGENISETDGFEWYNELRSIEAEVNHHILKMLPPDQENYVLAHQVRCLSMLFDLYMDEAFPSSEKGESTRLGRPVGGSHLGRSSRGRDRRKMISWKDMDGIPRHPR